ncbi:MAG: hypothetical protein KJ971_08340 [Firmicutes bacterium]|nr:hypothetical protein [Bacillota bacterium]
MNKLKARLSKAKSLISIKTYKKPMIFILLLMIFINIVILSIAAIIALVIDDSYSSFIDAFANGSLKWMLSPNAILSIENPNTLFLAVVVLIIGLVLFSGTIIALTTNSIKEYFQKKKSGSGMIFLDHHIVVLNWNNKVPELVADLLHVENRKVTVMILAEIDKSYAEKQIMNAIEKIRNEKKNISNLNVLIKNGDPLIHSDLLDISISKADSILIMNNDCHETISKNLSKSDLNVIKVILSLGRIEFVYNPPIVSEIKFIESKEKIQTMSKVVEGLHEHLILPICFDRRLGQIIAQTIIENKMEDVYLALFSFEGSEVYFLENTGFEDCLKTHSHAIPLAKIGNHLFVLSKSDETKFIKTKNDFSYRLLKTKPINEKTELDVYLVGKNNKLGFILNSFSKYEALHDSVFQAESIDENFLDEFMLKLNESIKPSTIVLLSDESQEMDSLDANVIDDLIYIEGSLKRTDINIIVELLDPKNDHIIKDFNIKNTIISNKIISLLLSKLALYKETAPFYENLLTIEPNLIGEDDQAIMIKKAKDCFNEIFPLTFSSKKTFIASSYYSFEKKVIVIGFVRDDILTLFEGNLDLQTELAILEEDLLILIKI